MKPIKFHEQNYTLNKPESMTDKECQSLPCFIDGDQIISKWKMTWKERLSALFRGTVWLSVNSRLSQPPVYLTAEKSIFMSKPQGDL